MVMMLVDFVLHIDRHLADLVAQYGLWIYGILFLIVFCETGLVVTPFLPGDSLLFAAGAIAAAGGMDIATVCAVLLAAAVLGDNTNYWIGRVIGPKVFAWENSRFFNRKGFDAAHAFFQKHGAKALVIARFMPIVRTFAPFTAGVANMVWLRFLVVSVLGGCLWIGLLTLAGFWFGNIPVVKANLEWVLLAIIALSLLPGGIAFLRHRSARTGQGIPE